MLRTNIPYLSKFLIGLILFICFIVKAVHSNEGPTLLKKSDKKEKLREEDLVTKEVNIKDLVILKYINFRSFTAVEDGLNETIKWFNKFKNKNLFIKIK